MRCSGFSIFSGSLHVQYIVCKASFILFLGKVISYSPLLVHLELAHVFTRAQEELQAERAMITNSLAERPFGRPVVERTFQYNRVSAPRPLNKDRVCGSVVEVSLFVNCCRYNTCDNVASCVHRVPNAMEFARPRPSNLGHINCCFRRCNSHFLILVWLSKHAKRTFHRPHKVTMRIFFKCETIPFALCTLPLMDGVF